MIGIILGLLFGISFVVQVWNDSGIPWYTGALVLIPFLLGLIFPRTMGIALMVLTGMMVIALFVALFKADWTSLMGALGIGLMAFIGQFVLGRIRPDAT